MGFRFDQTEKKNVFLTIIFEITTKSKKMEREKIKSKANENCSEKEVIVEGMVHQSNQTRFWNSPKRKICLRKDCNQVEWFMMMAMSRIMLDVVVGRFNNCNNQNREQKKKPTQYFKQKTLLELCSTLFQLKTAIIMMMMPEAN